MTPFFYALLLLFLCAACVPPTPVAEITTTATTTTTFPITIQHEDGETTFTAPVARIVTLSEEMMELPIALGIYPVGTASERVTNVEQGKSFTYSYAPAVSQTAMTYVGLESAPSLEAIALLQPDLIITPNGYGKERYDQLSQIAPTLTFDGADRLYWQEALLALAQLTGKTAEAEQVSADFDTALSEARTQLAPIVATKPRLALLFLPAPTMTFMVNQQFAFGATLADLGMAIVTPASVAFNEAGSAQVSDEVVAQVETDAFIIFRFGTDRFTIDELLTSHPAPKLDYIINTERPAAGPITDFDYLRDLTALLVNTHGGAPSSAVSAAPTNIAAAESIAQVPGFPPYAPAHPLLEEVVSRTADTIVVKHAYGETAIPANPQRIYVNDPATLQILLSLGIKPVGSAIFTPELPPALQEVGAAVTLLQDMGEGVNLEQLATLQPDLILGHAKEGPGMISEEQYATFSQIAPTVAFTGNPFFYWKAATRDLGDFFGIPDKAAAVLADYEAQLADSRAQAQAALGDETVTILLLFDTTMWLYSVGGNLGGDYIPLSPTSWAYRELGLTPGPEVAALASEELWAEISLELIPELKADHLVVFPNAYGGEEIGQGLDDYFDSPLWQTVPAVQNGKVHVLTADNAIEGYWTTPYLIEAFLATLKQ